MRLLAAVIFLMAVAISPAAAAPAASRGKMVVITPPSKWQSWSMDPARQTKEAFTAKFPHYLEGIYHNAMVPMKEHLREGSEGMAMWLLRPSLHIHSGCHPYTAVSGTGQVNKGLKNSGSINGHCNPGKDHHEGQTYVRGAWHKGRYAIMYSWYMPKDQNVNGPANGGHRHEWESIVVWVNGPEDLSVIGAAASAHGGFKKHGEIGVYDKHGSLQEVEYYQKAPLNHQLRFKAESEGHEGFEYPMIDYDVLPLPAVRALNDNNWGKANLPFGEEHFMNNLDEAWINQGSKS
ncbi:Putative necrosis inducing protein [Septoria linicola]|uniref:Necrosis inducing protein n=1 Tax=Septoria linicola TaxID=215465 RepID=A0A9Q9B260_9PEZI|nr:Putative necrosis inducing protein [Septoria linicola]